MKRILTNNINLGNEMPLKSGSINHIFNSIQETQNDICQAIINHLYDGTYGATNSNTPFVMYGCVNGTSGSDVTMYDGSIFWNGVVYHSPQQTILGAGSPTALYATFSTAYTSQNYYLGSNADPVEFTDTSNYYVHNNGVITWTTTSTGALFSWNSLVYLYSQNRPGLDNAINSHLSTIDTEIASLTASTSFGSWQSPTLTGGWVNSGLPVRYIKDGMGRVYMQGLMSIPAGGISSYLFMNLPTGYRPTRDLNIPVYVYNAGYAGLTFSGSSAYEATQPYYSGLLIINHTSGDCVVFNYGATAFSSYVTFDSVNFLTI